jgi:glycine hydroxymethyltransferase
MGGLTLCAPRQNSVAGDKSAQTPGGVRVGTPALTSRGMREPEMKKVAEFLHRAVQIAIQLQEEAGSKLLKDFVKVATEGDSESRKSLAQLAEDVKAFATAFPLPGIPVSSALAFELFEPYLQTDLLPPQDSSKIRRPESAK